jgi:hypothetical protein
MSAGGQLAPTAAGSVSVIAEHRVSGQSTEHIAGSANQYSSPDWQPLQDSLARRVLADLPDTQAWLHQAVTTVLKGVKPA